MIINILTLFPNIFSNFLKESIVGIAVEKKAIKTNIVNIRDFAFDKHKQVDDYSFGGGAGMIMKPEPLYEAISFVKKEKNVPVIYFTPQGRLLNQEIVNKYSRENEIVLVCGHYKEIDQRIRDTLITDEISIGDYVLSGGEIPAMVLIDAIARLQKGVLSNLDSALTDSHQNGLLGYPCYTRPAEFKGMKVPEVLLSGNHKKIEEWRREKSIELTKKVRPDLYKKKFEK
ncbi:MAG: tRNA (guanosine(37)-N1)-methyltransferase TrmD [Candidatus Cloacimonas sp. 4484_275]|nr:MAG: tRNA (guanosine(37)-N1)-methyltransferase TrmD [Candidatus Cloacimonas sp. 4484_275]RLC49615.1 MAG: tRNA (guanosine(37)-N1)-methyltransferase TrmD [Candidatus Cloacimonadota bacterium]